MSCSWSNHIVLLLMFVTEKVLLLLVIYLTVKEHVRLGSCYRKHLFARRPFTQANSSPACAGCHSRRIAPAVKKSNVHGWPSTQPHRITHNPAAHRRAAHNPAARWCAGSAGCNLHPDNNVGWPNVGPTSILSSRRWANVSPTYIAVWLARLWRGWRTQLSRHTTEPPGCVQLGRVLLGCV